MSKLLNISIIIPHYKPTRKIAKVLESIISLDYPTHLFEVIVVVDNAEEGISLEVKNRYPFVQWIENTSRIGTARAKNIGAERAKYPWLVFLDDDVELSFSWLDEMAKMAMKYPKVASFQSKVFFDEEFGVLNSTGGVANIYGYSWDRGVFEKDTQQYDEEKKILFASSCAMMVKKDIFTKVGKFDEDFFYMGEDYDLGLRIHLSGGEVYFAPRAVCYHTRTSHEKEQVLHSKYYLERNRILVLLKNYPVSYFAKIFLGFVFLKLLKYVSYLFRFRKHRAHYAGDILKGWFWIFCHLGSIMGKRKFVTSFRKIEIDDVFYSFSEYKNYLTSVNDEKKKKLSELLPIIDYSKSWILKPNNEANRTLS